MSKLNGAHLTPLCLTLRSSGLAYGQPLTLAVSQIMSGNQQKFETFEVPVYRVSPDDVENARISAILNEAEHVFRWHTDGAWRSEHKDHYARRLMAELKLHPKLISNIKKINNRVFTMIVYRAVELINEQTSI